jgi:hypothetical protein
MADDESRIRRALKIALSREPGKGEVESLKSLLVKQREHYKNKPDDAKTLVAIGQTGSGTESKPTELAAWTQLCRVILNLHETITRY